MCSRSLCGQRSAAGEVVVVASGYYGQSQLLVKLSLWRQVIMSKVVAGQIVVVASGYYGQSQLLVKLSLWRQVIMSKVSC